MNPKIIKENQTMKYRVLVRGKIVTECTSPEIANNMILSLPLEEQEFAVVLPVTNEGKQLLTESRTPTGHSFV